MCRPHRHRRVDDRYGCDRLRWSTKQLHAVVRRLAVLTLFGVLASKDQGNYQAQDADTCHHSQDGWNAELTFYDWKDKDTKGRSDFSDTSGEAAGCGS